MSFTPKPFLTFYGDDFTGSTDVMESLAIHGVPTVLFLKIPEQKLRDRFRDCRAMGIAGTSRSQNTQWMDDNLPAMMSWLQSFGADFCHYKVCSTFDSSPDVGSIGRAIEIGKRIFQQTNVPLLVGAPQLRRFTAFGHLFAAYKNEYFRIDRHPVMSRHPVTPMLESDLRIHMQKQTALETALIDLVMLQSNNQAAIDEVIERTNGIVLFDVDSKETQTRAGEQLLRLRRQGGLFVAGSSGVEYALLSATVGTSPPMFSSPGSVERIAVISGSVSPTTERQIHHAANQGFDLLPVNPLDLIGDNAANVFNGLISSADGVLRKGRSPLIFTALGPQQDLGDRLNSADNARPRISQALGEILARVVDMQKLERVVIAGGDTSSHAAGELQVDALTTLYPLASCPGSPLCSAHSTRANIDGLQIALKGGQIGKDDYFSLIRSGG